MYVYMLLTHTLSPNDMAKKSSSFWWERRAQLRGNSAGYLGGKSFTMSTGYTANSPELGFMSTLFTDTWNNGRYVPGVHEKICQLTRKKTPLGDMAEEGS